MSLKETFNEDEITRLLSGELIVKNSSNGEKVGYLAGGFLLDDKQTVNFNEQLKGGNKMNEKENKQKQTEKRFSESLPLKERLKAFKEELNGIEKSFKSGAKEFQAEAERLKKQREERELQEFYEKHAKKFNHKL